MNDNAICVKVGQIFLWAEQNGEQGAKNVELILLICQGNWRGWQMANARKPRKLCQTYKTVNTFNPVPRTKSLVVCG